MRAVGDPGRPCSHCGVKTYQQTAAAADKERYRADGWKRRGGRGLCVNCYERHRHNGTIDQIAKPSLAKQGEEAPACVRCGIKHSNKPPLCQDCEAVVGDLHELEAWSA